MIQTINELITYRELALQRQTAPEDDSDLAEADASDRSAFLCLDSKVNKERLFCNPDFDRDQLIRVSGIEKNRLAAMIRQLTGTNIPGYINAKRVEMAVTFMKQHPDYKLTAVAERCGFVSQTTFIRVFRNCLGMTPSEYRKTKISVFAVLLLLCTIMAKAQTDTTQCDTVRRFGCVQFKVNDAHIIPVFGSNAETLQNVCSLLDSLTADPMLTLQQLNISSYCSPEGPLSLNMRLAERRAESLSSFLSAHLAAPPVLISTISTTSEDWDGLASFIE